MAPFQYQLVGGQDQGIASVDPNTGDVFAQGPIPLSRAPGALEVVVRKIDLDPSNLGAALDILCIQPIAPLALAIAPLTLAVDESPSAGQELAQLTVAGGSGGITFAAGAGNNGALAVAPDGIVSVAGNALGELLAPAVWQYSTAPSFTFPVTATDSASATTSGTITINLNQVATPPSVTNGLLPLVEDAAVNSLVGQATTLFGANAAEFDRANIVGGSGATKFEIADNGALTLTSALDATIEDQYSLVVELLNSTTGLSAFPELIISVAFANRAPSLAISNRVAALPENSNTTAPIRIATATIDDSLDGGQGVNTQSLGGADAAVFSLANAVTTNGITTVDIVLNAGVTLDFPTQASYEVNITTADAALPGQEVTADLTLAITDSNQPPTAPASFSVSLRETVADGEVVATIPVSDPEGQAITATILTDDPTDPGKFAIAADGGLTKIGALSAATQSSYALTLSWSDPRNATTTTDLTITITAPIISEAVYGLPENSGVDALVAALPITFQGEPVTYAITDGNTGNAFKLVASELRANQDFDFETDPQQFVLTISASTGLQSDTATLTVNIEDVTELAQPSISGPSFANVEEFAAVGTVVALLTIDKGADTNASVALTSTTGNANSFALDINSGELTIAFPLDYETFTSHSLRATITNSQGSDQHDITIFVTDQPEFQILQSFVVSSEHLEYNSTAFAAPKLVTTAMLQTQASGVSTADIQYTVDSFANGKFIRSGAIVTQFTQDEIDNGEISFSYTVAAGSNFRTQLAGVSLTGQFTVRNINPAGDTPDTPFTLTTLPAPYWEFADITTIGAFSEAAAHCWAVGSSPAQVAISVTSATNGTFQRNGTTVTSFTQAEVNGGQMAIARTTIGQIELRYFATNQGGRSTNIQIDTIDEVPPVINDITVTSPVNPTIGTLLHQFTLASGDPVNWAFEAAPGFNTQQRAPWEIDMATGEITNYQTINPNDFPFTRTVFASNSGGSDTATITVDRADVNEAPTALAGGPFDVPITAPAGTVIGDLTLTDPDDNDPGAGTFSILSGNGAGLVAIDATTGQLTRTSIPSTTTQTITLNIQYTDAGGLTVTGNVEVNMTNVNPLAPTISADTNPITIYQGSTYTVNATISTLTISNPTNGAINLSASDPRFTLNAGFYGNTLQVVAGSTFNAATEPVISLVISIDDPAITPSPNDTDTVTINVTPIAVTINQLLPFGPSGGPPGILHPGLLNAVDLNNDPIDITFNGVSGTSLIRVSDEAIIPAGTAVPLPDLNSGLYYMDITSMSPSYTVDATSTGGSSTGNSVFVTIQNANTDVTGVAGSGVSDYEDAELAFTGTLPPWATNGTQYYYEGMDGYARATAEVGFYGSFWNDVYLFRYEPTAPGVVSTAVNNRSGSGFFTAYYVFQGATRYRQYVITGGVGTRTWSEETT